jgi:hypothetical protein
MEARSGCRKDRPSSSSTKVERNGRWTLRWPMNLVGFADWPQGPLKFGGA